MKVNKYHSLTLNLKQKVMVCNRNSQIILLFCSKASRSARQVRSIKLQFVTLLTVIVS